MPGGQVVFAVFRSLHHIWDFQVFHYKRKDSTGFVLELSCKGDNSTATSSFTTFPIEDFSYTQSESNESQTLRYSSKQPIYFPGIPDPKNSTLQDLASQCREPFVHEPQRCFIPKIWPPCLISPSICHCSVFQQNLSVINVLKNLENATHEACPPCTFVRPRRRCVVVVDAHLASCLKSMLSSNTLFCDRLLRNLRCARSFKKCICDYECLTAISEDSSNNHNLVDVDYMIEIFVISPWQIVDKTWSRYILGLFNKHVVLEEGLAWLSTLGGAHSSLGETFLHHAERAGEISMHQLRLAKELGNEIMIARCFLYWSWSLLQQGYLRKSRACVLNTWKYCQRLRCRDKILENMCMSVWTRLKYEKAMRRLQKARKPLENGTKHYLDKHRSACTGNGAAVTVNA